MQQYIQINNLDALKRILLEILKDVPDIYQLKGKPITQLVEEINIYNQKLQEQINKSQKEI